MPFDPNDPLYGGETFWYRIPDVRLNDVPVTPEAGKAPDSFLYEITDSRGNSVNQFGDMSANSLDNDTWEAVITAPSTPGLYHVHATATKGQSIGKWHDTFRVLRFT